MTSSGLIFGKVPNSPEPVKLRHPKSRKTAGVFVKSSCLSTFRKPSILMRFETCADVDKKRSYAFVMRGSRVRVPLAAPVKSRRPEICSGRFLFLLQFWLQTMPNRTFLESQSRTIDLCRKSPPIKMRHGNIYICTHFVYYVSTNAKRCCA